MTLKREDIKKLIIQQMLLESIQEEGVIQKWLSNTALKGGDKLTKLGQRMAPKSEEDPEFLQDLSKIADFIQMFRDSKTITDSDFYKKFVMGVQEQINEQYQSQFLKQILSKKPTVKDVQDFVNHIGSNPTLHKNLKSLELKKVQLPEVPTAVSKNTEESPEVKTEPATETPSTSSASSTASVEQTPATTTTTTSSEVKAVGTKVETPNSTINIKSDGGPQRRRRQGGAGKKAFDDAKQEAKELADLLKRHETKADLNPEETAKLVQLIMKAPDKKAKKESLQEAIVEEIFNLLTGKYK